MVEELFSYTSNDLKDLNCLMHELSPTSFCNEAILDAILYDDNTHVYVIRQGERIIAAGALCLIHTLEFTIASIESVVVSSQYRGRGFGKVLITHMIHEAQKLNVHHVHLTSNSKRVAPNTLYQSMGFVKYETNCYRLYL